MKLGKYIGSGKCRKVYHHPTLKDAVIKVAKKDKSGGLNHQNKSEWEVWNLIKDTKYKKYFCPCIEMTEDGKYLIQKKAKKTSSTVNLPKELKCKNGDIDGSKNIGLYNKKTVLVDYGHSKFIKHIKSLNL